MENKKTFGITVLLLLAGLTACMQSESEVRRLVVEEVGRTTLPTGPAGPSGPPGPPGPAGEQVTAEALNVIHEEVLHAMWLTVVPTGKMGTTGPPGKGGEDGQPGPPGEVPLDALFEAAESILATMEIPQAPPGPPGQDGAPGLPGMDGIQGPPAAMPNMTTIDGIDPPNEALKVLDQSGRLRLSLVILEDRGDGGAPGIYFHNQMGRIVASVLVFPPGDMMLTSGDGTRMFIGLGEVGVWKDNE